jgi:S1-C subfamily serine protease
MTLFVPFIVSCLLLLGVGLPSTWAQADVATLKKGVVKIVAESGNEREIGTGFIAAKGKKYLFIVTASHVVEGKADIQVTFFTHQEEAFPAKIVKMEGGDQRGLALLKVALLQSEWVIMGCFSDGLEHTGQDFQAEILLIA